MYTQLSDVEDEVNGLVTFDRRVCKMDPARMRKINEKLHFLAQDIALSTCDSPKR